MLENANEHLPLSPHGTELEEVRLISITPDAERLMGYCARVSNPANQDNPDSSKLLRYCLRNGHWSIFEQATMTIEISTSRAISPQILRHRSFSFQEFSQRYAAADTYIAYPARRQDVKNRQNSIDDLDPETQAWFMQSQAEIWNQAYARYEEALKRGVAKECARALLPLNTMTRLYMTGSVRSWIHYIQLRTGNGTQLEHKRIADKCWQIFTRELPMTAAALESLPNMGMAAPQAAAGAANSGPSASH